MKREGLKIPTLHRENKIVTVAPTVVKNIVIKCQ